jgi:hypothetical protein
MALVSISFVVWVGQLMGIADLLRMSTAFFAVVASPQGFANLTGSAGGFAAVALSFRIFEGIPFGFIETICVALINKSFPLDELGNALGTFMVVRSAVILLSAPLGGLLYTAGGFSLPYLVIGALAFLTVPLLRLLDKNTPRFRV